MQKHLQRCDCVIEVHDSRIPHLGRNPKFDLLQSKPRVVVMNKTDLASKKGKTGGVKRKRKRWCHGRCQHCDARSKILHDDAAFNWQQRQLLGNDSYI